MQSKFFQVSTVAYLLSLVFTGVAGADDSSNVETITVHGNPVVASGYDALAGAIQQHNFESSLFPSSTITDALTQYPGVETSGQGGWFQTFSIRGTSGARVTTFLSGIPIVTERRAGTSVHFVDPALLSTATILSGPATSIYGNGAVGGVVQLNPLGFDTSKTGYRYSDNGDANNLYAVLGGADYVVGVAYAKQENSEAANGLELNEHGERWSGLYRQKFDLSSGTIELLAMPSYLNDVGRANADFYLNRITETPKEQHLPIRVSYTDNKDWQGALWLHDSDMTTTTTRVGRDINEVDNTAFDYGLNVHRLFNTDNWKSRAGLELSARRDVNADETLTRLSNGLVTERAALANGRERVLGLFTEAETKMLSGELQLGARWAAIQQDAETYASTDDDAFSLHAGWKISDNESWSLSIGVGSAVRFPSLTERYYNGMTARGDLNGNPNLESEQSLGWDVGWTQRVSSGTLRLQAYQQAFDDYIERINLPDESRTYINLSEGTIEGAELSFRLPFNTSWYSEFSAQHVRGEDGNGNALSQIPADRFAALLGYRLDVCQLEVRWTWRDSKTDIGSDERAFDDSDYGDISAACDVGKNWQVSIVTRNASDELYRLNADDQAAFAQGRTIQLSVEWRQ